MFCFTKKEFFLSLTFFSCVLFNINSSFGQSLNFSDQGWIYCGDSINSSINAGEVDGYYFYAFTNYSMVQFRTCGSDFDSKLYLINSSMDVVDESDDYCSDDGVITLYDVKYGDSYYVAVGGYSSSDYGNYTLNATCIYDDNSGDNRTVNVTYQGVISCGEMVYGSLGSSDVDYYLFNYTYSYPSVSISTCSDYTNFDPYFYLINASGSLTSLCYYCGDCDSYYGDTLTEYYFSTGMYYIFISGILDSGNYSLNVSCGFEYPTTTTETPYTTTNSSGPIGGLVYRGNISCGEMVYGSIDSYYIDIYSFYYTDYYPGVRISTCNSSFDTYLYLYNASFYLISSCDDCGNCGTRTILTEYELSTGMYYIGVGGFYSDSGNYSLNVSCANYYPMTTTTTESTTEDVDPTLPPNSTITYKGNLSCGETTNSYINADEFGSYSFYLNDYSFTMVVISSCGSDFDTILYVYSSNFSLLTYCDNDCGYCNDDYQATITGYGVPANMYYILIGGSASSYDYGNYTLNITCSEYVYPYNSTMASMESTTVEGSTSSTTPGDDDDGDDDEDTDAGNRVFIGSISLILLFLSLNVV